MVVISYQQRDTDRKRERLDFMSVLRERKNRLTKAAAELSSIIKKHLTILSTSKIKA